MADCIVPRFRGQLENGADQLTRPMLLKLLLQEEEMLGFTRHQLDRIDRHISQLRQLICRQSELVEKERLTGRDAERFENLLLTLNDLMATYQIHRQRINASLARQPT
jgi:reverse gyrase